MQIHGVTALSTHHHMLLSPEEPDQLARFMHYVQTKGYASYCTSFLWN